MNTTPTRLSRKAQGAAAGLSAQFDEILREHASLLAEADHQEFADESHVREAYRMVVLKLASKYESK